MAFQTELFKNRQAAIGTKHNKERAIAQILFDAFGINLIVPENMDTDQLGTFTGEIERSQDPLLVLRKKCEMAYDITGCDLCLASEGSFGSHPEIFLIPAGEEWLMIKDFKNDIEIVVKEISAATNFNGRLIRTFADLKSFALQVDFPNHGLILSNDDKNRSIIYKGIADWNELEIRFNEINKVHGQAFVETDMRAMNNPTRMSAITHLAQKLVSKMNSLCPECNRPGLGITKSVSGLPCELCNAPTRGVLYHVYECEGCDYLFMKKFPYEKTTENPRFCDNCNP